MPVLGVPHAAALEPKDVRVEPVAVVEEDIGNEEFSFGLEQEERPVALGPQPVAVLPDEAHNLALRQAEGLGIACRAEHLGEGGVLRQLVHRHRSYGCGSAGLVRAPPDEVRVNAAGEYVFGGGDQLGAVGLVDDQSLAARDEAEDFGHAAARRPMQTRHEASESLTVIRPIEGHGIIDVTRQSFEHGRLKLDVCPAD